MKTANRMSHTMSVRAAAILKDGKSVGKIITNINETPNGYANTTTIWLDGSHGTARAGGSGYDKLASNIDAIMHGFGYKENFESNWQFAFESLGFTIIEVL